MNILDTVNDKGNWMGLCIAKHFTEHEYGDLLPPTYREDLDHPMQKQAKAMIAFQILRELAQIESRKMMAANPKQAQKYLKQILAQAQPRN